MQRRALTMAPFCCGISAGIALDRMEDPHLQTSAHAAAHTPEAVFARAAARAAELELAYAGAVTPVEAYHLTQHNAARIVDVRTGPEYSFVGRVPDTPLIEWHGMDSASCRAFLSGLRQVAEPDEAILLICRSGVRSHAAATVAAQAGYTRVYNVLEGFEGQLNAHHQRGKVNGWRHHGLPWVQD
jgi:rhodanese-related sulfurtransferase